MQHHLWPGREYIIEQVRFVWEGPEQTQTSWMLWSYSHTESGRLLGVNAVLGFPENSGFRRFLKINPEVLMH